MSPTESFVHELDEKVQKCNFDMSLDPYVISFKFVH